MLSRRCINCAGSGQVMGGGMLIKTCHECDGAGKIKEPEDEMDYLVSKQTESYQAAKKRLMKKHKDISDEKAESLLDAELKKLKGKN